MIRKPPPMTDLPKEDRDLIERVLGKDEVRWLARIGCNTFSVEMVAKLLAAARSAPRKEVDEGMVSRAAWAWGKSVGFVEESPTEGELRHMRAALIAALGASQ